MAITGDAEEDGTPRQEHPHSLRYYHGMLPAPVSIIWNVYASKNLFIFHTYKFLGCFEITQP